MRITDTFNLGHLKCTVFAHESQYTLQIEDEYGSISYKLKSLGPEKISMVKDYLPLNKIKDEVIASFRSMRKGRDTLLDLLSESPQLEDDII